MMSRTRRSSRLWTTCAASPIPPTAGKSSQTFVINLYIDPLPAWAVGTFDGYVRGSGTLAASGEDGSGEGSGESAASPKGLAAVTVSAAGKISGKILEGGKTWTLSAAWFAEARLGEDASPHLVGVVSGATVGRAVPSEPLTE